MNSNFLRRSRQRLLNSYEQIYSAIHLTFIPYFCNYNLNQFVIDTRDIFFMRLLRYLFMFIGFSFAIWAQDSTQLQPRIRLFGAYNMFRHSPDFTHLPEVPTCCSRFTSPSDGVGFNVGLAYELPLPYRLFLGLKASLLAFDARFEAFENILVQDGPNFVIGNTKHSLDADFLNLKIESYLRMYIIDGFSVTAGGFVAPFLSKKYTQQQSIVEPNSAVFTDSGINVRNRKSGDIPGAMGVWSGLNFGFAYDLPVNKDRTLIITPDVSYSIGLNNIADSTDWKANSLSFGLSLAYSPKAEPTPEIINSKITKIDTLIVQQSDYLYDTFRPGSYDTTYSVENLPNKIINRTTIARTDTLFKKKQYALDLNLSATKLDIKTKSITQAFPILDLVFFDANSAQLNANYCLLRDNQTFRIEDLPPTPMDLHNNILNIIGLRMKQNPTANLQLKGFADSTTEAANPHLPDARANTIKQYLINTWQIAAHRITIQANKRPFPTQQVATRNDSGYAENRRVMISSSTAEILAPIKLNEFHEIINISPRSIDLTITGADAPSINQRELIIYQAERTFSKMPMNPDSDKFHFEISDSLANALLPNSDLEFTYSATAQNGSKLFSTRTVAVQKALSKDKIYRMPLILFDVASDDIPKHAEAAIESLLSQISPASKLRIIGYTDILGDSGYNKQLSTTRAANAARLIKKYYPSADIIETKGVGSDEFAPGINSYNSPAERFLSRTVIIEVIDN